MGGYAQQQGTATATLNAFSLPSLCPAPYQGPGMVTTNEFKDTIRTHHDIEKGSNSAKYVKKSLKFFDALGQRIAQNGHVCDVYACAFDQCGTMEMRSLTNCTG